MSIFFRPVKRFHLGVPGTAMTLVDLVVVLAILGMLASIKMPNVAGLIGEGEEKAARTELHLWQSL